MAKYQPGQIIKHNTGERYKIILAVTHIYMTFDVYLKNEYHAGLSSWDFRYLDKHYKLSSITLSELGLTEQKLNQIKAEAL